MPCILVFMRYPETGKVKTRLASSIGDVDAARIYEKLVRRTLGIVGDFRQDHPEVRVFVMYSPEDRSREVARKFPGPWSFFPQEGTHIGDRMARADERARSLGCRQTVIIGTDIPMIDASDLGGAFEALNRGNAVLGPAADGGFYLIGLDRPCPSAFQPRVWGTGEVLSRTEDLLRKAGHRSVRIRKRADLDRPEDLHLVEGDPIFQDRLSIIIPTLHPVERMCRALDYLESQMWPGDEIIVVQGTRCEGVRDITGELRAGIPTAVPSPPFRAAAPSPPFRKGGSGGISLLLPGFFEGFPPAWDENPRIRHILSPRGRGLQLNRGTQAAEGNLFLFLHDDSYPPDGFAYLVRKIASFSGLSLGCFELSFFPETPSLALIAKWANFRSRRLKLPYGDQGLFCRREVFVEAGGFKRAFLMEDVDFVRRCRKLGKIFVAPQRIRTSSERYLKKGVFRASMQNHVLMLMYLLGVDDRKLYRIYYGE